MRNKMKIFTYGIVILLTILLMVLSGCGSADNEPKLSTIIQDDGSQSLSPTWAIPSSSIEAVYEDRYYVTLYWNKVTKNINLMEKTNIAGYKVYKYNTSNVLLATYVVPANSQSDKQTYVDTDTQTNVYHNTYRYRVAAFDTYMRESLPSQATAVLIEPSNSQSPAFPTNIKVYLDYVAQKATLVWDPVTKYSNGDTIPEGDLFGYEISRTGGSSQSNTPIAVVENRTYYVDALDLSKGGTYVYSMKSILKNGTKSRVSSSVALNTSSTQQPSGSNELKDAVNVPNAPHFGSVTGPDATGLRTITFDAPVVNTDSDTTVINVTEYVIYRSETREGPFEIFSMMNSTGAGTESYAYTGSTNKFYYYRISARDKYANESPMSGVGSSGITLLSMNKTLATLGFKADSTSLANTTGIKLSWSVDTSIDSATSFKVYRSLLPQGPYYNIGNVAHVPGDPTMEYEDLKARVDGIPPIVEDQRYYYRISAVTAQGESGPSYYVQSTLKTPQTEIFFTQMQIYRAEGNPQALSYGTVFYQNESRSSLIFNFLNAGETYFLRFPRVFNERDFGTFRLELYAEYSGLAANSQVQMSIYPEDDNQIGIDPLEPAEFGYHSLISGADIVQSGTTSYSLNSSGAIEGFSANVIESDVDDTNDYFFVKIEVTNNGGSVVPQQLFLEKIVFKGN